MGRAFQDSNFIVQRVEVIIEVLLTRREQVNFRLTFRATTHGP